MIILVILPNLQVILRQENLYHAPGWVYLLNNELHSVYKNYILYFKINLF